MKESYIYYLFDRNDVVKYVGRGKGGRYKAIDGRSQKYRDIINSGGYTKIICFCKSTTEAVATELDHIHKHKGTIINKVFNFEHNCLNYKELSSLFEISDSSPSGLVWKTDRVNISNTIKARAGERAGSIMKRKYWTVPVNGKYVKVHRVVMTLHTKQDLTDPDILVNHIDGNGLNNKVSNLEFCNHRENAIRTTNFSRNTSGVVGVSEYVSRDVVSVKARITLPNGKRISKQFSSNKYGYDEAFRLACEWRKRMEHLYYHAPTLTMT